MKTTWQRSVGGVVLMALAWAAVWAPVAVLVGVLVIDPDNSMDEMWPAIGAYPGFLSAVVFAMIVALAEGRRGLDELPLSRAAGWGAVAGVLVGALPFAIGEASTSLPLWVLAALVIGSFGVMSTVSAVGTAMWARRGARGHTHTGARPVG